MNELQVSYIKQELEKNKGSETEITYQALKKIASEFDIDIKGRITKTELIKKIFDTHEEMFLKRYSKLFRVPDYVVKKIYNLSSTKNVHELEYALKIPKGYEKKMKLPGKSFTCRVYPIDVLEYEPEQIQKIEKELMKYDIKLRLQIQNIDFLPLIEKQLNKFLNINENYAVYQNRDQSYYCYYSGNLQSHLNKEEKQRD